MRFLKSKLDFSPFCKSKSHAFSYITLLAMYLEKVYMFAKSHTRHFMNVFLEVLQHIVAYVVGIISKSATCRTEINREITQITSLCAL